MTQRDDMVFAPTLGRQTRANAPVRARLARRLARENKKGGLVGKVAKLRAAQRLTRSRSARSGSRRVDVARGGASGLRKGAAARAPKSPAGVIMAGLLIGGLAALRLISDEPLEKTGARLNSLLLGDLDEEARAKMTVRKRLQGNANVMHLVGNAGKVDSQVASIADDMFKLELKNEQGATKIREEFPVNSTMDMLILRATTLLTSTLQGNGTYDNWGRVSKALSVAAKSIRLGFRL